MRKFISLCFWSLTLSLAGQNLDRTYNLADRYFKSDDLLNASVHYNEIMEIDPTFKDVEYKAEICSLLTNFRNKSMEKILGMRDTFGQSDVYYDYWLGLIYADKYRLRNAITSWTRFLRSPEKKQEILEEEARGFIEEARRLLTKFDNPGDYEIHQLEEGINSAGDELTPVYFDQEGEILFASSRESTDPGNPVYYIYEAKKVGESWATPKVIPVLGEFTEYNANLEFVNRDKKLFQYKSDKGGDLFYSVLEGNAWKIPEEFDAKIPKVKINSHFFINESENRIVFASDENKSNGLDLYQTYKDPETGDWSKPIPFSNEINTQFNEDMPFLSLDETKLYFSSDREDGLGGYDIYVSELNTETFTWSEPKNLGFPVNTPDDERHFKLNLDQRSGYLTSNRYSSLGEHDIFLFWEIDKIKIQGRVLNAVNKEPIPNAIVTFRPSQYEDEYFRAEATGQGVYETKIIADEIFKVEIEVDGKVLYTDSYEVHDTGGQETSYFQDFYVNVPGTKAPVVTTPTTPQVNPTRSSKKVQFVYFEEGSARIKKETENKLNSMLSQLTSNNNLKLELRGHTDSRGSDSLNKRLSQQRANAVRRWLVSKGIAPERITTKAMGEKEPLASNDDETEGRELNRRVEVFIIN